MPHLQLDIDESSVWMQHLLSSVLSDDVGDKLALVLFARILGHNSLTEGPNVRKDSPVR